MKRNNLEKLNKIKKLAEKEYKSIGKVFCPYLKKEINFNAKGLHHLKTKGWNKARLVSDQYLRFKFLKLAPLVVSKSHTLQEYNEDQQFERMKINSRWEKRLVKVFYYAFISVCGDKDVRVKIIIKEIEGRDPYFWSVVPFWKSKNHPTLKEIKKAFHEGDPENE